MFLILSTQNKMIEDILIFIGIAIILYIIASRIVRSFYKFPAPACIGYFLDSRWRKKLQPSGKIIERSGIEEGAVLHVKLPSIKRTFFPNAVTIFLSCWRIPSHCSFLILVDKP